VIFQRLRNNTFLLNKKIGLAVSGGVDSMVLLDSFYRLKSEMNFDLTVLHYNHKWRKKSYLDSKLLKNYCNSNNIKFLYKETKGKIVKSEEAARNERYSFFRIAAKKYNLDYICTAHHKDDHFETIIFRLLRGSGPAGLLPLKKSLKLDRKTILFRPFLDISKTDIEHYAKHHRVGFVKDITNEDIKYKRNLIRKKIIPLLLQVNSNAVENVLNSSDLIYSFYLLQKENFPEVLRKLSSGDKFVWDKNRFLELSEHKQKALLYWFLNSLKIKGSLNKIANFIDAINNDKKIELKKDFYLQAKGKQIFFKKKSQILVTQKCENLNLEFLLNGKVRLIDLGKNNILTIFPFTRRGFDGKFPKDKTKTAYVDLSVYKNKKITVRHRSQKDVFQPIGFSGPVKLKKYLINKKISYESRYNLPLICFGNEVLWLPGYALSNKLKVAGKPTHILKIEDVK